MALSKQQAGSLGGIASKIANRNRREEAKAAYLLNPTGCQNHLCPEIIPFEKLRTNKFCSRSCSAAANNRKTPKRSAIPKAPKPSREEVTSQRFESGLISDRGTLKKRLLKISGHRCSMCSRTRWMGQAIPLEVDHINGDAGNNLPTNLRLLCPNCHAMTPTAKGKNKGKGRKSRGLPLN